MSDDEELKRRIKQLENELHQPPNYQKYTVTPNPKFIEAKPSKRRLSLKYKILMWFVIGLGIVAAINFLVGAETIQLFFLSVIVTVTSLSLLLTSLILVLPTLILIYVIYRIIKWLA